MAIENYACFLIFFKSCFPSWHYEVCRYFETEEKILKYYVRCRRKTACIKINYLEEKNRQKKQKSRLVGSSNKYFNLILFFVLADF